MTSIFKGESGEPDPHQDRVIEAEASDPTSGGLREVGGERGAMPAPRDFDKEFKERGLRDKIADWLHRNGRGPGSFKIW